MASSKNQVRTTLRGWTIATALAGCLAVLLAAASPARAAVSYTGYIASVAAGTLTPFDTATNGLSATIPVNHPAAVAITPDGSTAWIANYVAGSVTPLDLATGGVGNAITVGTKPDDIAITPDGAQAYVTNFGSNSISVIDLSTRAVTATISVGWAPDSIVITPDGTKAYSSNSGAGTVTPITTSNNTAGPAITVGISPDTLAVTPDGSTVWVGNLISNTITPISTSTDSAGPSVTVNEPSAIGITPDGTKAYVANWNQGTVTPVTLSTDSVGSPIPAGSGSFGIPLAGGVNPYQIAITADGATAYLGDDNSHTVTPINVATDTAHPNIALGSGPEGIAITPDQAPAASFSVSPAPAGSPTAFNASASTVRYGAIVSYAWDIGDGHTATTSTPTTTHTYATPGKYTATVTETDTAGTSTAQAFTGKTMSRSGAPSARATRTVSVTPLRVVISTTTATITPHGDVPIRLKCPSQARGGCVGTLTIQQVRRGSRLAYALSARCARGCRPLGRANFRIHAGQMIRVEVHISFYGRRLLAQRKTLRATVTAGTVSGGRTATTVRTITLRARPGSNKRHSAGNALGHLLGLTLERSRRYPGWWNTACCRTT